MATGSGPEGTQICKNYIRYGDFGTKSPVPFTPPGPPPGTPPALLPLAVCKAAFGGLSLSLSLSPSRFVSASAHSSCMCFVRYDCIYVAHVKDCSFCFHLFFLHCPFQTRNESLETSWPRLAGTPFLSVRAYSIWPWCGGTVVGACGQSNGFHCTQGATWAS